ncbi:MAG: DUF1972 domain-containing protein [Bacteroidota bacterium]
MKIAILGTRGIPNHYGGFEQYAELLAIFLTNQGWDVTVYNSHNHPYQSPEYKGVKLKHIFDPEKKIGTIGQFIYDLGCILHTRKQNFDIIYQLGYTSSAIFNFLFPRQSIIVTNMDGMEWKRSKYNKYVQRFLMFSERIAVKRSDYLIADSLGIKEYLDKKYNTDAFFSAYTAELPEAFLQSDLADFSLEPKQYNILVARLEPENNVEIIMEAHTLNNIQTPLIVIGNYNTKYGMYLKDKFKNSIHIKFIGGVYQKAKLDSIRHYSNLYFHGHSVGGTNPSLLEAMACGCNVVANDNIFNRSVLGDNALYFKDAIGLNEILLNEKKHSAFFENAKDENITKIKTIYSENFIFQTLKEKLIEWHCQNASRIV